ncbi:MAG: hypothetical protein NC131_18610 [Roseburia sp.]|nr:hypothetical protein [Roseburia sp.]
MFSDPFKDFQDLYSQKLLQKICSTQPKLLQVDDYIIIFQPYCTPGTAEEILPYVHPFCDFIKEHVFRDDFSAIYTAWDNFVTWAGHKKHEIEQICLKNGQTYFISSKIKKIFQYFFEYKCDYISICNVAYRISEFIQSYILHLVSSHKRKEVICYIVNQFGSSEIIACLIILHLCLSARKEKQEDMNFIFDVFNRNKILNILNKVSDFVLKLDDITEDMDKLIRDCDYCFRSA